MENNTTEYENEKLVIDSNEKGEMSSGSVKKINKNGLKRKNKSHGIRRCPKCGQIFWDDKELEEHIADHGKEVEADSDEEKSDYEPWELIDMYTSPETNKKRRAYYKTKAGLEAKKKCKENANVKRHILNHLSMIHGSYETIKKLVKML